MSVRIRTGNKTDPDRNPQLIPNEKQIECSKGAISVYNIPCSSLVRVCVVRGIVGRKAQIADLNEEELEAFTSMLIDAKLKLNSDK